MSYVDLDPLSAFTAIPSTWLAQLLANTEALHDGTGFANGAIPATALAAGAITLASAAVSSGVASVSSGSLAVPSLSASIVVPAGGRPIVVEAGAYQIRGSTAGASYGLEIWDGPVGSGTLVAASYATAAAGNYAVPARARTKKLSLTAGTSKTYNVALYTGSGTAAVDASATLNAWLTVEVR